MRIKTLSTSCANLLFNINMYLRSHVLNGAPVFIFACTLGSCVRERMKKRKGGKETKGEKKWKHRFVSSV
jgi:hypothetical protein